MVHRNKGTRVDCKTFNFDGSAFDGVSRPFRAINITLHNTTFEFALQRNVVRTDRPLFGHGLVAEQKLRKVSGASFARWHGRRSIRS